MRQSRIPAMLSIPQGHRIQANLAIRHGQVERIGRNYLYRLTDKGAKVALLFILFHKCVCGPLANSLFYHRPDEPLKPASKIETAYHKADHAIQQVLDLLAA